MNKLLAFVALVGLAASSCAHLPPSIKDFGVCVSQETGAQVQDILAEVAADLASGLYLSLLTDLAKRIGIVAVDCAVHEIQGKSMAQMAAAPDDQLSAIRVKNANAWLGRK